MLRSPALRLPSYILNVQKFLPHPPPIQPKGPRFLYRTLFLTQILGSMSPNRTLPLNVSNIVPNYPSNETQSINPAFATGQVADAPNIQNLASLLIQNIYDQNKFMLQIQQQNDRILSMAMALSLGTTPNANPFTSPDAILKPFVRPCAKMDDAMTKSNPHSNAPLIQPTDVQSAQPSGDNVKTIFSDFDPVEFQSRSFATIQEAHACLGKILYFKLLGF